MRQTFILVSTYSAPSTGAQVRFDRLANYLLRQGHPVIWITPRRNDTESYGNLEYMLVGDMTGRRLVSFWMSFYILRFAFRLWQLRETNSILISFGETNLIPSALAAFISNSPMSFGMRSNIKKCNEVNSRGGRANKPRYSFLLMFIAMTIWRKIYCHAAQVTVQTPQAKASAIANFGISESKLAIIENDLPVERTTGFEINRIISIPRRALFVGDDSHVKGFDVLIGAIGEFSKNAPSIKELTIVGVSKAAFLELQRSSQPDGPKLIRLERTEEIISVMAAHDLLIVPSREDQFPNIVLEALALGLPVVGSDADGVAYILNDNCLLFEAGNARDLLRVLSYICTKDGYAYARQTVIERAERFRFDWEKRYFQLLSRV